jgi:hypothetical protein
MARMKRMIRRRPPTTPPMMAPIGEPCLLTADTVPLDAAPEAMTALWEVEVLELAPTMDAFVLGPCVVVVVCDGPELVAVPVLLMLDVPEVTVGGVVAPPPDTDVVAAGSGKEPP